MKYLDFIILLVSVKPAFAMERPVALGQPLKQEPTAIRAIKDCCCDRGYCASCAIGCSICCGASIRYIGYSLFFHEKCRGGWRSDYNSVKRIIYYAEGSQVVASALTLTGINAYYFQKHYKEKKD